MGLGPPARFGPSGERSRPSARGDCAGLLAAASARHRQCHRPYKDRGSPYPLLFPAHRQLAHQRSNTEPPDPGMLRSLAPHPPRSSRPAAHAARAGGTDRRIRPPRSATWPPGRSRAKNKASLATSGNRRGRILSVRIGLRVLPVLPFDDEGKPHPSVAGVLKRWPMVCEWGWRSGLPVPRLSRAAPPSLWPRADRCGGRLGCARPLPLSIESRLPLNPSALDPPSDLGGVTPPGSSVTRRFGATEFRSRFGISPFPSLP